MKRLFIFLSLLAASCYMLVAVPSAFAQTTGTKEIFEQGHILQVVNETTTIGDGGYTTLTQTLKIQITSGPENSKTITIDQSNDARIAAVHKYAAGDDVVLDKSSAPDGSSRYTITDTYRIPELWILAAFFFILIVTVAGKKGVGAVVGLTVSLAIIVLYIVPQILFARQDPLTVSIIGSCAILFITTFLAHGFSKQTAIAVASTFLALFLTYILAILSVNFSHLLGLGTEDSYLLELAPGQAINPKGLLLGGILIGTLGALNDITTTQVASLFALFKANPQQTFVHLFEHGISIGREHIASLINTLVLAYAGTSLPIFIFLILNPNHLPLWVILNSEQFAQEIVQTMAGSMGLILSVPIATILAAWLTPRFSVNREASRVKA